MNKFVISVQALILIKLNNTLVMSPEADPGMEGMLIGRAKADEISLGQKLEEAEEYDADEQVVGGVDLEKQQQSQRIENIGMCVYIE